ncbi:MAG: hypothetical protein JW969_19175 [Spirochaetales bacterium]|nr:hypothetical protein [Spirochaetales bacterium]
MNKNEEFRIRARLNQDGELVLKDMPFKAGDSVELVVKYDSEFFPGKGNALKLFSENKLFKSSRIVFSSRD